jgi:hypothetical protein
MKIVRAGVNDTDIFSEHELNHGACCFYTEDRSFKYYFEIRGREATFFANTDQYISQAIDEFLFYSGFIVLIKDTCGRTLASRTPNEPYLCEISKIQPSQFYVNKEKLHSCKKWIQDHEDIIIPIVHREGKIISLDGHTRLRAAHDLGYTSVYIYISSYDETIFYFVDEAIKRGIYSVADMEVVSGEDYKLKWDQFCDDLFAKL